MLLARIYKPHYAVSVHPSPFSLWIIVKACEDVESIILYQCWTFNKSCYTVSIHQIRLRIQLSSLSPLVVVKACEDTRDMVCGYYAFIRCSVYITSLCMHLSSTWLFAHRPSSHSRHSYYTKS